MSSVTSFAVRAQSEDAAPVLRAGQTSSPVNDGGMPDAGIDMAAGGDLAAQAQFAQAASMLKHGPLSHFDSQLASLYLQSSPMAQQTASFTSTVEQFDSALTTGSDGKEYVVVDVTAKDGDGAKLLHHLEHAGLQEGSSFGSMASGLIAVDHLDALLHTHDLGFARESAMETRAGSVESQAVPAEATDTASSEYGVDGSGLRVGILSDSFARSSLSDTMADDIASGDLPTDTQILQDHKGSDEGRAMAQLVHDIAPGSAIDFATAFAGEASFANNILRLAAAGDKIIADDVGYFDELAYQEGPIAQAVTQVAAQGVTYFSAAGNDDNQGLEQNWKKGGKESFGGVKEKMMGFAPGQDYIPLTLHGATYLVLQWDQPGISAGNGSPGSADDLDLFVTDQSGNTVYKMAMSDNIGGDPVEILHVSGHGTYYVRVGLAHGPAPTEIKLMALSNGGNVDLGTDKHNFNDGTDYGHPAADGAIAVGAAWYEDTPAFGVSPPQLEDYSSAGPTRFWYDDEGNRLAAPIDQPTPQITAVDGVDTTAFFGHEDPDGDGHPNFFGTSAAAPDAAGVAALMLQANSGLTPADVLALLQDSAIDMDNPYTTGPDPGIDSGTGAGLIQADAAVGFAVSLHISNTTAIQLTGTHFGDTITGNGFANVINGGDGDDIITGGIGADTLTGGAGADMFVFTAPWDSPVNHPDTITDLDNSDTIDLSAIDANEAMAGDQAFTLVASFDGNAGEATLTFETGGSHFSGKTVLDLYTNTDSIVDVRILLVGDHQTFSNFIL